MSYVKRCDELERKLRFFSNEIEKFELDMHPAGSIDAFLRVSSAMPGNSGAKQSGAQLLETLEVELESYES